MPHVGKLLTSRKLVSLTRSATAMQAAEAMAKEKVGAILVCGADQKPEGIFTERDLMVRVIVPGGDPAQVRLESVMTAELFTAHPAQKTADIRREMQRRHIRHVPMVLDGQAIGMLSLRDLLRADLAEKKSEVEAITAYIQGFEEEAPPESPSSS